MITLRQRTKRRSEDAESRQLLSDAGRDSLDAVIGYTDCACSPTPPRWLERILLILGVRLSLFEGASQTVWLPNMNAASRRRWNG